LLKDGTEPGSTAFRKFWVTSIFNHPTEFDLKLVEAIELSEVNQAGNNLQEKAEQLPFVIIYGRCKLRKLRDRSVIQ
jgi:hypothetical protein